MERAATEAAAAVGVGPEVVAFVEPEGWLVTRFIEGAIPAAGDAPRARAARPRRRARVRAVHDGPPIPGRFDALGVVEAYRDAAVARGATLPAAFADAHATARRIDARRRGVTLRPCHNDLLNANFIDDGDAAADRRLGVRGDGRPVLRSRELLRQPRARRRRSAAGSCAPTASPRRPRHARRST